MNRSFWLKAAGSLVLAMLCLALPFVPQSTIPFGISVHGGQFQVIPSPQGVPLPPALQRNDRMRFDLMRPAERLPYMMGIGEAPAGTVLNLVIERDRKILHVPVQLTALPPTFANHLTVLATDALTWLQVALGLLLLWRGRHKAAAGVAAWCLAGAVSGITGSLPIPMPLASLVCYAGTVTNAAGTLIGLMLVAEGLVRDGQGGDRFRWYRPVFATLFVLYISSMVSIVMFIYLTGKVERVLQAPIILLHLAAFALPIAMMVISYTRVSDINRARIRWFLASMLGIVLAYVTGILPEFIPVSGLTAAVLQMALTGLALCGFTYAVLRHQLVSIRLVVNRALAYGIITSFVVVVFAVLSAVLEQNTLSAGTNRLLVLLVPLLLGATLHTVKHHVDGYINKWFFRRRYRAESALNNFARTCAHIEQPAQLLKSTADELFRNSGARGVALYLANRSDGRFHCTESRGVPAAASVDTDDLALVRLRAGDTEVDLHGVVTAFGDQGFAFPLALPKRIMGAVICGARPAEQYTADERKLFAHVAGQVAVALHALEIREQQQMLQDIAAGSLQSLAEIQNRARALLAPNLPV